ncbi:cytochrome oxidase assembly protein 1 [Blastocladiella emersonii ATCC 22665]|nr:cytochrome oxidase assembly protein 1 [Blastocladiella emersonii ATCC 22665]
MYTLRNAIKRTTAGPCRSLLLQRGKQTASEWKAHGQRGGVTGSGTPTLGKSVAMLTVFGASMFGLTKYFLNMQRRKNLVMDILMFQLRTNPTLKDELGESIDLAGWKWIDGEINQLRGIVDVKFDVTGTKGGVATIAVKMQRYPHDPTRWQTVDYHVEMPGKSWNGYVDDESGTLVLQGGQ